MKAIEQVHLATQYLAAAGKSFLEHKEDDSHTNLGFNSSKGLLETWPMDDQGLKLSFAYESFSLIWSSEERELLSFALDNKSHNDILGWINKATTSLGISEAYHYDLHYDLPYAKLTEESRFSSPSLEELGGLLKNRNISHQALEDVVDKLGVETTIRVWPHHFDSGGYVVHNGIGIGFGMAIPDAMIDDFYLYTSGYKGHDGIATSSFSTLSKGKWLNDGFKGAILSMSGLDSLEASTFLAESIKTYMTL